MSEIFKTNIQFSQYSRQSPKRVNFILRKTSGNNIRSIISVTENTSLRGLNQLLYNCLCYCLRFGVDMKFLVNAFDMRFHCVNANIASRRNHFITIAGN
jgi:hypothetical protein